MNLRFGAVNNKCSGLKEYTKENRILPVGVYDESDLYFYNFLFQVIFLKEIKPPSLLSDSATDRYVIHYN